MDVLKELVDVCADWENIGLELRLSPGILDAIKGPYKVHEDCLRDMLKKWLNTSPDPSWQSLIEALRSPIVGKEPLARHLETKYCKEGSVPPAGKQGNREKITNFIHPIRNSLKKQKSMSIVLTPSIITSTRKLMGILRAHTGAIGCIGLS